MKAAFRSFIENLPFYGFGVMCIDHPVVQDMVGSIADRRVITYGENPQADVRLLDVDLSGGRCRFKVQFRDAAPAPWSRRSTSSSCPCRAATTR